MQCSNTTLLRGSCLKGKGILGGREMRRGAGRGGGVRRREGGKGLQGGHYFHVINIHQTNVKILIGQFSKHVNYGLGYLI